MISAQPVYQRQSKVTRLLSTLFAVAVIGMVFLSPIPEPMFLSMPADNHPQAPMVAGLATPELLLGLINTERAAAGVAPLRMDHRLNQSAQRKADDMTIHNYFAHVNPHSGKFGPHHALEMGIGCSYAAENLSRSGDWRANLTAVQAVNSWLGSAPHRDALLNPRYLLTGFGVSGAYVVEHFCDI